MTISGNFELFQYFITEVLKLKQNFHTNKVIAGKTPFFVIGQFCTHHSIFLNIGSDKTVLYGDDTFSIFALSTKKQYPNFLKKAFVLN